MKEPYAHPGFLQPKKAQVMNKYIPQKGLLQALFIQKPQLLDPEPLVSNKNNFISIVSSCNKTEKELLNYLISKQLRYNVVTFGQDQMAKALKKCRMTIHRTCLSLKKKGLISYQTMAERKVKRLGFMWTSNSYRVNQNFFIFFEDLKKQFYALKAYSYQLINDKITKNVTPYINKVFINLSNSLIVKGVENTKRLFTKSYQAFNKKMESDMETAPIKLSDTAREITKYLNLSLFGQIRLLVYPEKALAYVFADIKKKSHIKQPFYFLLSQLDKYCHHEKLHIDWDLLPLLKRKYNMPDKPDYFNTKPVAKITQNVVQKVIISPLVGKFTKPHPSFAQFIPEDLRTW